MNTQFAAVCTATALSALALHPVAQAGDREWSLAGKVLTGVAAAHVLSHIIDPGPRVYYAAPQPTVVYQYPTAPTTVAYVGPAPVAPAAPVYASAPTTAVVYQTAPQPQIVYVAAPPVYYAPAPVVIYPGGHRFYSRRCFARW